MAVQAIGMVYQLGVRVRISLTEALGRHLQKGITILGIQLDERERMTDKNHSIADLLILIHVTEIDTTTPLAVGLALSILIDQIGLVTVSRAIYDTSLHSSTQKLT